MAREKSAWDRFREKEKERDEEEREKLKKVSDSIRLPGGALTSSSPKPGAPSAGGADHILVEMIKKAEVLMEQIQNLYNMYVAGMERIPPNTHRKQLEDIVFRINDAAKTSASLKFRAQQFHAKYQMYKDKWERLIKDIESGKVVLKKRTPGAR